MADQDVEFADDYCTDGKSLLLSVIVGNNQMGYSLVKIDGKEVAEGKVIQNLSIPAGAKTIFVKTMTTDTNDNTKDLDVSYVLTGGKGSGSDCKGNGKWEKDVTVADHGDSAIFRATFNLK